MEHNGAHGFWLSDVLQADAVGNSLPQKSSKTVVASPSATSAGAERRPPPRRAPSAQAPSSRSPPPPMPSWHRSRRASAPCARRRRRRAKRSRRTAAATTSGRGAASRTHGDAPVPLRARRETTAARCFTSQTDAAERSRAAAEASVDDSRRTPRPPIASGVAVPPCAGRGGSLFGPRREPLSTGSCAAAAADRGFAARPCVRGRSARARPWTIHAAPRGDLLGIYTRHPAAASRPVSEARPIVPAPPRSRPARSEPSAPRPPRSKNRPRTTPTPTA